MGLSTKSWDFQPKLGLSAKTGSFSTDITRAENLRMVKLIMQDVYTNTNKHFQIKIIHQNSKLAVGTFTQKLGLSKSRTFTQIGDRGIVILFLYRYILFLLCKHISIKFNTSCILSILSAGSFLLFAVYRHYPYQHFSQSCNPPAAIALLGSL